MYSSSPIMAAEKQWLCRSPVVIQRQSELIMVWRWGICTTMSERETNEQLCLWGMAIGLAFSVCSALQHVTFNHSHIHYIHTLVAETMQGIGSSNLSPLGDTSTCRLQGFVPPTFQSLDDHSTPWAMAAPSVSRGVCYVLLLIKLLWCYIFVF